MGVIAKILAGILFLSLMVFVTFFGRLPALRRTPIASLYRLIWVYMPSLALALDQRLTSGRFSRSLTRFGNYVMYDRHPTVVVLFLVILTVSEFLYLPQAWSQIGWFTKMTAAITVIMPYVFLYLSCAADPGYITPQNHAYHMSLYPYDHSLFQPGNECRTCRLLKPARSKHCSICKRCVAKADHHCVFINSCVGYGNQHWFLLLLASTALLTTYGAWLGISLLSARVKTRFPMWALWPPKGMDLKRYLAILSWGLHGNVKLGATSLLAFFTTPLVWGLCLYTFYQVYCGVTTNESLKWSEWKDDMNDGYAFRRRLPAERKKDPRIEALRTRWPVEPEYIMVATSDGEPPRDSAGRLPGAGEWERVWGLKSVENLYDMGLWDNFADVFVSNYNFGKELDSNAVGNRRGLDWGGSPSGYPP